MTKILEDLDFADDVCMLSPRVWDVEDKMLDLEAAAQEYGLKINDGTTISMRINVATDHPLHRNRTETTPTLRWNRNRGRRLLHLRPRRTWRPVFERQIVQLYLFWRARLCARIRL